LFNKQEGVMPQTQTTRARVVVIDDWPHKTFPFECDPVGENRGEVVVPDIDENGVCSYDMPIGTARRLVGKHPERFCLYQCAPVQCEVSVGYTTRYTLRYPWYYEMDDDGKIEWKEQRDPPWDFSPNAEPLTEIDEATEGKQETRRERAHASVTDAILQARSAMGDELANEIVQQELARVKKSDVQYLRVVESYRVVEAIRRRTAGYLYQKQKEKDALAAMPPSSAQEPPPAPVVSGGALAGVAVVETKGPKGKKE
jgi:hypothetical protein